MKVSIPKSPNLQETPAFRSKYLDNEKIETESEILTIRINKAERELINELKQLLSYSQDAKVIKIGLVFTRNVIRNTFSDEIMKKLCAQDRTRGLIEVSKENAK